MEEVLWQHQTMTDPGRGKTVWRVGSGHSRLHPISYYLRTEPGHEASAFPIEAYDVDAAWYDLARLEAAGFFLPTRR